MVEVTGTGVKPSVTAAFEVSMSVCDLKDHALLWFEWLHLLYHEKLYMGEVLFLLLLKKQSQYAFSGILLVILRHSS